LQGLRNKTPPRIIEHRLRVFHVDDNENDGTETQESPTGESKKCPKKCLKLESLSSSRAHLSFSLSDTIIEEHWTQSNTLSALRLWRIRKDTFDNHHSLFWDPSDARTITKLSFEGPCSTEAVLRALEYFFWNIPSIESIEFSSGFFYHEVFSQEELDLDLRLEFPQIKSLKVDCDVQTSWRKLEESQQKKMELRIVSLLNVASGGMTKTLRTVSLSLPNTPEVDKALNAFIRKSANKGVKMVDYANAEVRTNYHSLCVSSALTTLINLTFVVLSCLQIRYKLDSSSKSNNNKPQIASSKRRRASDSSSFPEVEITQLVSKDDKIKHVTLSTSSSSSDDDQEQKQESGKEEDDGDEMKKSQFPHIQSSETFSPLQGCTIQ